MSRPLSAIAREIRANWNVNFGAVPYLEAMAELNRVEDNYFADRGCTVVSYFLANAGRWRGDVAKRVKAELKTMAQNCKCRGS